MNLSIEQIIDFAVLGIDNGNYDASKRLLIDLKEHLGNNPIYSREYVDAAKTQAVEDRLNSLKKCSVNCNGRSSCALLNR